MSAPKYNKTLGAYVDNYDTVLEYHVDTNGDKTPDYVLMQIILFGMDVSRHDMGALLEFTERANEQGEFYIDEIRPMNRYAFMHSKCR